MRTATDRTVGARLDRLAWSRLHTTILFALGAGWLFDSFEVQMFSSAVGPLGDHFGASVLGRDALLAVWLSGILLGALAGGRLTDRFGRRKLFVITLLWYAGFTVATGLAPNSGAGVRVPVPRRPRRRARSTRSSTPRSPSSCPPGSAAGPTPW